MNLMAILKVAGRSLFRNRIRSLLTMLGIIIGVAAVIVTVSIGAGARVSVQQSINGLGSNLLIVGQHVDLESMRPPPKLRGARAATICNLQGGTIRNFSAELARGEVVGLTGLIGSGYDEVIYMAYGAVPAAGGVLELGSRSIDLPTLRPREAIAAGCILIPSDRPGAGAVPTLNVTEIQLPIQES